MSEPLRVCVDFDIGGDPIVGTVTAGAEQRPFTGWLGLIAGLQNAIGDRNEDGGRAGVPGAQRPAPDRREEEGEVGGR
jgi:hypothetical protein